MYDTGEKCAVLERLAMVGGRRVRIIHGLNISHKELIYLLQKSTPSIPKYKNLSNTSIVSKTFLYSGTEEVQVIKAKYYAHAPRGIDW